MNWKYFRNKNKVWKGAENEKYFSVYIQDYEVVIIIYVVYNFYYINILSNR